MIEELAEAIVLDAHDRDLPIVVLGDDGQWCEAFLSLGERILSTNYLSYLTRAVYVIARPDSEYSAYEFPRGSVVVDLDGTIPERPGVSGLRFKEDIPALEGVQLTPEEQHEIAKITAELGE